MCYRNKPEKRYVFQRPHAEGGAESVLDKLRRIMAGNLEETE